MSNKRKTPISIDKFISEKYQWMKKRINGDLGQEERYFGLDIMPKDEFMLYAKSSEKFIDMFNKYKESGFTRKLCPTPHRKEESIGYTVDNIEWVTQSENSRLAVLGRGFGKPRYYKVLSTGKIFKGQNNLGKALGLNLSGGAFSYMIQNRAIEVSKEEYDIQNG